MPKHPLRRSAPLVPKIPQSVCSNIQSTLTRFWWDSEPGKRKVSWISWDKMAKPKSKGGLRFKEITSFNDALLAKIGWRIMKNPISLLARCLLGRYCHTDTFLEVKAPSTASHGWRSVLVGGDLLVKQLGWMVGNGESINVWKEPWLSHSEQLRPYGPAPEHLQHLRVSDLLLTGTLEWDIPKIEECLPMHKAQILNIRPSKLRAEDTRVWLKNINGEYSTRSGYLALTDERAEIPTLAQQADTKWLPNVWNIKTFEK